MIEIHQYPPAFGLTSLSPFCIKVQAFCLITKIPFKSIVELNPMKGPKGKMPFIVNLKNQQYIADSSFILNFLFQNYDCSKIKDHSEAPELYAFQKMIEESLYFAILYNRWVDSDNKSKVIDSFKGLFPSYIGKPFLHLIRLNLIRQSKGQGIGRHSKEEVYGVAVKELRAIEKFLGTKTYFSGESISSIDTTVYAFLILILKQPLDSPMKEFILQSPNLLGYLEKIEGSF